MIQLSREAFSFLHIARPNAVTNHITRGPLRASKREGVSPFMGLICNPLTESNCVPARGGGEQLNVNFQSVG